ncbi:MED6-domain-containing protein [Suillus discolor]|uniref:Mediator of RNA polymerase II transcription subunit 6 n=1 Tax=Suillus discolor TaxID=1912936 RepID=A0A9P7FHD1_9AGAM|nr:MED6-domain-containing protein [Suillus discolor]KAG2117910.1 MED6-domain-containing protein [Suillus discolor]
MDFNDLHPSDDYSHRFFIWHEWIQANGPLTSENVFDYFATSMFYDKQSNNQVLRMQTMHTGVPILNESEELKRFTGIEFALVHAQPPSLFIIHKRERSSPEEVRPLAAYFIMNNRIYRSPDVYGVLSNRLLTSLYALQSSLDILRINRPDYTPRTGFIWPITEQAMSDDATKKWGGEDSATAAAETEISTSQSESQKPTLMTSGPKKQQNNMLMYNAMRSTAFHSKISFSSSASVRDGDSVPPESLGIRSSATPAPTATRAATPASGPTPQDTLPPKGAPGAGKKKKKRTLLAVGAS